MSALDTAQPTQTLSCLVYDPTVQDIDVLLDGLDAGCIPRAIAPGEDPMRVIGEVLERHRCQDLHLLGHGFPGGITLGGRQIDANAWQGFFQHTTVGDLITIAANHIQNQQINFWSCKTGEGELGMNFINTVAQTTGATVNASTGYVGSSKQGGSWDLDVSAKPVPPFDKAAMDSFEGVLGSGPSVSGLGADLSFTEGAAAVTLFPSATVTDVDGTGITAIRVALSSGAAGDFLSLPTSVSSPTDGQIQRDGPNVQKYVGDAWVNIATIDGTDDGTGGNDLLISVAAPGMSQADAQSILQAITFENTLDAPPAGARTIGVTVYDSDDEYVVESTTVEVTAVADAPVAADATKTVAEDGTYTFAAADFGFSDADGDSLATVTITGLPASGTLSYDGTALGSGDLPHAVAVANVGLLEFAPAANENGADYASLSFTVTDDSGATGSDTSAAKTITFDVASVPDITAVTSVDNLVNIQEVAGGVVISGTADQDGDTITIDGFPGLSATVGAVTTGQWSITLPSGVNLSPGANMLMVRATDSVSGNVTPLQMTVNYDNSPPAVDQASIDVIYEGDTPSLLSIGDHIKLVYKPAAGEDHTKLDVKFDVSQITGVANSFVTATQTDWATDQFEVPYTIPADGLNIQSAKFSVVVTDEAGNTSTLQAFDTLVVDNQAPTFSSIQLQGGSNPTAPTEANDSSLATFRVTFTETVTGPVVIDMFTLQAKVGDSPWAPSGGIISSVSAVAQSNGTQFDVAVVTPILMDGGEALYRLAANPSYTTWHTLTDGAGNDFVPTASAVDSQAPLSVDNKAPSLVIQGKEVEFASLSKSSWISVDAWRVKEVFGSRTVTVKASDKDGFEDSVQITLDGRAEHQGAYGDQNVSIMWSEIAGGFLANAAASTSVTLTGATEGTITVTAVGEQDVAGSHTVTKTLGGDGAVTFTAADFAKLGSGAVTLSDDSTAGALNITTFSIAYGNAEEFAQALQSGDATLEVSATTPDNKTAFTVIDGEGMFSNTPGFATVMMGNTSNDVVNEDQILTYYIEASEAVTGLAASDFAVTNGTVTGLHKVALPASETDPGYAEALQTLAEHGFYDAIPRPVGIEVNAGADVEIDGINGGKPVRFSIEWDADGAGAGAAETYSYVTNLRGSTGPEFFSRDTLVGNFAKVIAVEEGLTVSDVKTALAGGFPNVTVKTGLSFADEFRIAEVWANSQTVDWAGQTVSAGSVVTYEAEVTTAVPAAGHAGKELYVVEVTPDADLYSVTLELAARAESYADLVGNAGQAFTEAGPLVGVDTVDPDVTISSLGLVDGAGTHDIGGQDAVVKLTFDATVSSGDKAAFYAYAVDANGARTWIGTVSDTGTGSAEPLEISVAGDKALLASSSSILVRGVVTDAAGNTGYANSSITKDTDYTVDLDAPQPTIAGISASNGAQAEVVVTFSEGVSGATTSSFDMAGGSISSVDPVALSETETGYYTQWKVTYQPQSNVQTGNASIWLEGSSGITDVHGDSPSFLTGSNNVVTAAASGGDTYAFSVGPVTGGDGGYKVTYRGIEFAVAKEDFPGGEFAASIPAQEAANALVQKINEAGLDGLKASIASVGPYSVGIVLDAPSGLDEDIVLTNTSSDTTLTRTEGSGVATAQLNAIALHGADVGAGDVVTVTVGADTYVVTASVGDTDNDVLTDLQGQINGDANAVVTALVVSSGTPLVHSLQLTAKVAGQPIDVRVEVDDADTQAQVSFSYDSAPPEVFIGSQPWIDNGQDALLVTKALVKVIDGKQDVTFALSNGESWTVDIKDIPAVNGQVRLPETGLVTGLASAANETEATVRGWLEDASINVTVSATATDDSTIFATSTGFDGWVTNSPSFVSTDEYQPKMVSKATDEIVYHVQSTEPIAGGLQPADFVATVTSSLSTQVPPTTGSTPQTYSLGFPATGVYAGYVYTVSVNGNVVAEYTATSGNTFTAVLDALQPQIATNTGGAYTASVTSSSLSPENVLLITGPAGTPFDVSATKLVVLATTPASIAYSSTPQNQVDIVTLYGWAAGAPSPALELDDFYTIKIGSNTYTYTVDADDGTAGHEHDVRDALRDAINADYNSRHDVWATDGPDGSIRLESDPGTSFSVEVKATDPAGGPSPANNSQLATLQHVSSATTDNFTGGQTKITIPGNGVADQTYTVEVGQYSFTYQVPAPGKTDAEIATALRDLIQPETGAGGQLNGLVTVAVSGSTLTVTHLGASTSVSASSVQPMNILGVAAQSDGHGEAIALDTEFVDHHGSVSVTVDVDGVEGQSSATKTVTVTVTPSESGDGEWIIERSDIVDAAKLQAANQGLTGTLVVDSAMTVAGNVGADTAQVTVVRIDGTSDGTGSVVDGNFYGFSGNLGGAGFLVHTTANTTNMSTWDDVRIDLVNKANNLINSPVTATLGPDNTIVLTAKTAGTGGAFTVGPISGETAVMALFSTVQTALDGPVPANHTISVTGTVEASDKFVVDVAGDHIEITGKTTPGDVASALQAELIAKSYVNGANVTVSGGDVTIVESMGPLNFSVSSTDGGTDATQSIAVTSTTALPGASITQTVDFSTPGAGGGWAKVVAADADSQQSYQVTIEPLQGVEGNVSLSTVSGSGVQDAAGNTMAAGGWGMTPSLQIDTINPVISVTIDSVSGDGGIAGGEVDSATPVVVTVSGELQNGYHLRIVAEDGTVVVDEDRPPFTTGTSQTLTVSVPANVALSNEALTATVEAKDFAGNTNSDTDTAAYTVESVATTGTVTVRGYHGVGDVVKAGTLSGGDSVEVIYNPGPDAAKVDTVTVDLSEFGGGSAHALTLNSGVYSTKLQLSDTTIFTSQVTDASASVDVTVTDRLGDKVTLSDKGSISLSTDAPDIASVSLNSGTVTSNGYLTADTATFDIQFDEPVTGINEQDIVIEALERDGITPYTGFRIENVSANTDGSTYSIDVAGLEGFQGSLVVGLSSTASVFGLSGNAIPVTTLNNKGTAGVQVDNVDPSVTAALAAADTGTAGDGVTNDATVDITVSPDVASWEYNLGNGWVAGSGSSFELPEGVYAQDAVQVRVTDNAGNVSSAFSLPATGVEVDTTAATISAAMTNADTGTASDGITNDATVDVTVTGSNVTLADDVASWEYNLGDGNGWVTGSGSSFELPAGQYAADQVQVRVTDEAGNVSAATSVHTAAVEVDTTAATISAAMTNADTGTASDGITNDATVDVTVTGSNVALTDDVASWEYTLDSGASTVTWVTGSGSSFELPEGQYAAGQVQVRVTDEAGNVSAATSVHTAAVEVDTSAPSSSSPVAPAMALAADTGTAGDGLTSNAVINVTLAENTSSWAYSLNSGTNWSILRASSDTSFSVASDQAYASGVIQLKEVDPAGNETIVTLGALTTDATSPTFSSGATANVNEDDIGPVTLYTAAATDANGVTYSLKAGVGDGDSLSITGGVVTVSAADYESKASYSFTVVATDDAGNASEKAVTVTVNNVNDNDPVLASMSAVTVDEGSASGTAVATAGATDADGALNALTYSLSSVPNDGGTPASDLFAIDSSTGAITLTAAGHSVLNYESSVQQYTLTVQVSDGTHTDTTDLVVKVGDVADHGPKITISDPDMDGTNSPVTVTFTFDQPTSGFDLNQIASTDGNLHGTFGALTEVVAGLEYTASFTPDAGVSTVVSSDFFYRPIAQVDAVTFSGVPTNGDAYSVTVNGQTFIHTVVPAAVAETVSDVTADLVSQINGSTHASINGVVTASATGSVITLTATAASAGVAFTATSSVTPHYVNADEDATVNAGGTANVAEVNHQVSTISIPDVTIAADETVTVTIGATSVTVTAAEGDASADLAQALAAAITTALSAGSVTGITPSTSGTDVVLTATPGTALSVTVTDTIEGGDVSKVDTTVVDTAAVAQVDTVTISGPPEVGDSFSVTVDGVTYTHTVSYSVSPQSSDTVATALAALVEADSGAAVTASVSGSVITLTADTAGTAFTVAAAASDRPTSTASVSVSNQTANSSVQDTTAVGAVGTVANAGNTTVNYTVETVAPGPATVALNGDTGGVSDDGVTSNRVVDVTLAESGNSWEYSTDGGSNWTAGSGTSFELASDAVYAAGAIQVKETDGQGNETVTSMGAITTDNTDPVAATVALNGDTGGVSDDGVTSNRVVDVTLAESGNSWEYSTDGGSSWTAGSGTSFTLAADTTYASGAIQVKETDAAGNDTVTPMGAITTDNTDPVAATVALNGDTGGVSDDGVTSNRVVDVTLAESGNSWEYSTDGGSNWTAGSGTSFTLAADTVYAAGAIQVKETDAAGNDTVTPMGAVTTDNTDPSAITITGLAAGGVVGEGDLDSPVMAVTAEAGSKVVVTFTGSSGNSVDKVIASATGTAADSVALTTTDDVTLGQGPVSVSVTSTDLAGNVTTKGSSFALHTETTPTNADGSVDQSQFTANGSTTGSTIKPYDEDIAGGGDKLDLSGLTGDATVDLNAGTVTFGSGTNVVGSRISAAATDGFDIIQTGDGDDRIIGNANISEIFSGGAGNNLINGGDSAGTVDYVDYRGVQNALADIATVSGSGNTRTVTIDANKVQAGAVLSFGPDGFRQSITVTQAHVTDVSVLVAALTAAMTTMEAAAGSPLAGATATASDNVITIDFGGVANPAEIVEGFDFEFMGVEVDLQTAKTLDLNVNWTGSATVGQTQDSLDELVNIEGVLGTGYNDILTGGSADNVIFGEGGDDQIEGNAGDDVLSGGAGKDVIVGGEGDDRIIGGAGDDILVGGLGKDTFVIGLNTGSDSIRDFDVAGILTGLSGRSAQALDKIDFTFTNDELKAALVGAGAIAAGDSLPGGLAYRVQLSASTEDPSTASAGTPYHRDLNFQVEVGGSWYTVTTVSLDWESNPFGALSSLEYQLKAISLADPSAAAADPALFGTLTTDTYEHKLFAAIQFERIGEIIDTTAAEAIVGARTGDFFVMSGGNDTVVGGLGSDRYEARIQGQTDVIAQGDGTVTSTPHNNGVATINELGRSGGGLEEDAVFIEGADLSDLTFSRTQIAAEGAGRTLKIDYQQHRGVDDPTTALNEAGLVHATGTINIFNQFSLSQGDVYAVEKIQVGAEVADQFNAAVKTYYVGQVDGTSTAGEQVVDTNSNGDYSDDANDTTSSIAAGDRLVADADVDSLLIGTTGYHDTFVIDGPTAASAADGNIAMDRQEVWVYGMGNGSDAADKDDVVIRLGGGGQEVAAGDVATFLTANDVDVTATAASGSDPAKVTVTFGNNTATTADDLALDIFFADAGNVDSTFLADRIKWES